MSVSRVRSTVAVAWLMLVAGGAAQAQARTVPTLPPIRELGRRVAIAATGVASVDGVRQLSDGRVIVNDSRAHELVLFDSGLQHSRVIADSTESTNKAYGPSQGWIMAYRGDSTLFVDPVALAILVFDQRGAIARTLAVPRASDASTIVLGHAALDAAGRLVYRYDKGSCGADGCVRKLGAVTGSGLGSGNSSFTRLRAPDSVPVVRSDMLGKTVDTLGYVAVLSGNGVTGSSTVTSPDGSRTLTTQIGRPIPIVDEWAVVADGSVAVVRGHDYHIDWINADGTRASSKPMAHEWHRMSDSDKDAVIDSIIAARDSDNIVGAQRDSANRARNHQQPLKRIYTYVRPDLSTLPDYRSAIEPGSVYADADNNLWIRQGATRYDAQHARLPAVYDIVNRQGVVVDRVQLPPSMTLAGFGPGVVYLTSREATGLVLVEYRVR